MWIDKVYENGNMTIKLDQLLPVPEAIKLMLANNQTGRSL